MYVVFFVALQEEVRHVYQVLSEKGAICYTPYEDTSDLDYEFFFNSRHEKNTTVTIKNLGGMSNLTVGVNVAPYTLMHQPDYSFLVGISGTLNPQEAELGDVVVSSAAKMIFPDKIRSIDQDHVFSDFGVDENGDAKFNIDIRKRIGKRSFFRFRRGFVRNTHANTLLSRYLNFKNESPLTLERAVLPHDLGESGGGIRSATVLGSDFVVDSDEYIEFLNDRNAELQHDYYYLRDPSEAEARNTWNDDRLVAVDMETFGYFRALEACKGWTGVQHGFAVRGISDYSANKEQLDSETGEEIRRIAARNASSVAIDMVEFFRTLKLALR